jgi:hypothetical protein
VSEDRDGQVGVKDKKWVRERGEEEKGWWRSRKNKKRQKKKTKKPARAQSILCHPTTVTLTTSTRGYRDR